MMKKLFTLILLGAALGANAQNVGINTNSPKATLEVVGAPATPSTPDGITPPKLTRAQLIAKTGYGTDQAGAIVHVTDLSGTTNAATTNVLKTGLYCFSGDTWVAIASKVSAYVNAGVAVSLGNINARLASSGARSLEISFDDTVEKVSGTSINNTISVASTAGGRASTLTRYMRQSDVDAAWNAGAWVRWQAGMTFTFHGASQQINLTDETNKITYRITLIVGGGYVNNFISIEVI